MWNFESHTLSTVERSIYGTLSELLTVRSLLCASCSDDFAAQFLFNPECVHQSLVQLHRWRRVVAASMLGDLFLPGIVSKVQCVCLMLGASRHGIEGWVV